MSCVSNGGFKVGDKVQLVNLSNTHPIDEHKLSDYMGIPLNSVGYVVSFYKSAYITVQFQGRFDSDTMFMWRVKKYVTPKGNKLIQKGEIK